MNLFRRAICYCWRQKVRSMILLLVFTLLASAALIALSVGHATAKETDEVKQTVFSCESSGQVDPMCVE